MPRDFNDTNTLLESLKKKDVRAFNYLYQSFRNSLFLLAVSILKSEEAAKDTVQEFFIDFWHHQLYKNVKKSLKYYLFSAIYRRSLMHLRGERAYAKMIETITPFGESEVHFPIENRELKQSLDTAINRLPPMAQKVFRLHYQENASHAQIGKMLGISHSTVSNHMDRALKGLRADLKNIF